MRNALEALALALALAGCATPPPIAPRGPPPARVETPPTKPGSSYFWVEGNWAWDEAKQDYYWKPGRWEAVRNGWYLAPGGWAAVEGGWQWREEHWERGSH